MELSKRSKLYRLIYQSRSTLAAKPQLQIEAANDILRQSRRRNINCGVSGILLYNQLEYFQVLEGSKGAVDLIFQSIVRDRRHANIVALQRGPADSRIFHSWSMAYKELAEGDMDFDYPLEQFPAKLLADGLYTHPGCLASQVHQPHLR